jgi:PleD family two-component response regulator
MKDYLTGLEDWRRARSDLRAVLKSSSTVAYVLAVLDEFGQANIAVGNEGGDQVLRDLARLLSARCKSLQHVAAPIGLVANHSPLS